MTEMDITYIFIRYISVTIRRRAKDFYRRYDRIIYCEKKEFLENIEIDKETINYNSNPFSFFYKNIEEKLSCQESLLNGLNSLDSMEKHILCEKFLKQRSDADLGKEYSVSGQMISKRRRNILKKMKNFFYPEL
ncbi:sigma-70 family RNA polymerase sigma factor [Enterococcus devriesei]|uniref:sigma-70 family RNA polymerase sigma factor n=1 Tax=Enterococcus devriesei TaxID=319970 RepID=UPI0028918A0B|nr:sigma-70 family RNA polymerase sigma factor [Enterococcus devriesei]MDT2822968.1 sigma-70 family RNA polymerase sigma factor [Enterococcus devriesei]